MVVTEKLRERLKWWGEDMSAMAPDINWDWYFICMAADLSWHMHEDVREEANERNRLDPPPGFGR